MAVAIALVGVSPRLSAAESEIKVNLKLDNASYVLGERIRGVIRVVNSSPEDVTVGNVHGTDRLFVEVMRSADGEQLTKISRGPFTSPFDLGCGQGQRLEVFLADHYGLASEGDYLAKPVLVHGGIRYEGAPQAFSVVPGMVIASALQMFRNRASLKREFDLRRWSRGGEKRLFLSAVDEGDGSRWRTTDLGPMMSVTKPSISILSNGVVLVIHRLDSDNYVRSEVWSTTRGVVFRRQDKIADPEIAGQSRVQDMFKATGEVEAKKEPWWKFW